MYTLTIKTSAHGDRTEEEFFFTSAADAYTMLASIVSDPSGFPLSCTKTFIVSPMKGSLPIDAEI